jgi:hypothetical protein
MPTLSSMKSQSNFFFGFAAFGLMFVLFGCVGLLPALMLEFKGEVAEGTVVGYATMRKGQMARVVKFTTASGEAITFKSKTSSNMSSTPIGDPVRVLYLPRSTSLAEIDDFQSLWLMPAVFGGLGSLVAYVGFAGLYQLRKQKKDLAAGSTSDNSG